jgi:hypothetical protein
MVAQAHHEDLLHQPEEPGLPARPPRPHWSMSRRAAAKLGVLLIKLGTWLKQFEQPDSAL